MPDRDHGGSAGSVVRGQVDDVAVVIARQPGGRTVAATAVRSIGTAAEQPGEVGFAHLAEHLVHQYARTADDELVEGLHSRVGGVSNAQTYPFHTEFTFVVPAGSVDDIGSWFGCARARLTFPGVGDAEVASERAVIDQEVNHRLTTSPVAGFPWIDALGTLSDDFGLAHDGFADLTGMRTASAQALRAFWRRTSAAASTAVGIVTPWEPAEVADRLGLTEAEHPGAEFRPVLTGPRVRTPSVPTRFPVRAEVRWIPDAADQPRERSRALAILAACVLDLVDATGLWQTGLFGPWLGPDHGVVILRSATPAAGPGAGPRWPSPTSAQVEQGRRTALLGLDHQLAGTATYAALLARDAVYGLDPAETRAYLFTVRPAEVIEVLDRLAAAEPGHIVPPMMASEVAV